jgi:hypothetical protein
MRLRERGDLTIEELSEARAVDGGAEPTRPARR